MVSNCNRNTRSGGLNVMNARARPSASSVRVSNRNGNGDSMGTGGSILTAIVGGILLAVVIVSGIKLFIYFFTTCVERKNFFDYMFSFDFWVPCTVDMGNPEYVERAVLDEREVYHIGNQEYTSSEAECKCASYGARLATYPELVEAYNRGLNTCDYGWIENGQAFYTTQKCYWDEMKEKSKKTGIPVPCGKPGLHGGNFPQDLKFGVTCYGIKPVGTVAEVKEPKCIERGFCERPGVAEKIKKMSNDDITPFNPLKWSQYDN